MLTSIFNIGYAQSYLGLDGGLEGSATVDNTTVVAIGSPVANTWTKSNASLTIESNSTEVRSGNNSLSVTNSSASGRRVYTPLFTVSSTTSQVTIQYFVKGSSTTNTCEIANGVLRNTTESLQGTYTASPTTWTKYTYNPSSSTFTSITGILLARSIGTGGTVYIDDVAIYPGSVDNSAPLSPSGLVTTQSGTSINLTWTNSGSTDVIEHVLVRFATNPLASDDPNTNGIYATGQTTPGSGTIVYKGMGTAFNDNTLPVTTVGTTYYYKLYAVDKAYNYSNEATSNITLPIVLNSFTAILENNQSLLSFTTATEKNNDYFAIERSSDGRTFTQIGAIKGAGTTLTPQDYTYTDEKPLRGINFYRLKQVDFDGQFSYSPVVSVVFGKVGNVVLYPTPTTSTMNVRLEEAFQTEANWQIIDLMGRIITEGIFPAEQTDTQIPVGTLSEGNYVLRVTAGQEVITQKFRKIEQ
jgi:hypothetical protein